MTLGVDQIFREKLLQAIDEYKALVGNKRCARRSDDCLALKGVINHLTYRNESLTNSADLAEAIRGYMEKMLTGIRLFGNEKWRFKTGRSLLKKRLEKVLDNELIAAMRREVVARDHVIRAATNTQELMRYAEEVERLGRLLVAAYERAEKAEEELRVQTRVITEMQEEAMKTRSALAQSNYRIRDLERRMLAMEEHATERLENKAPEQIQMSAAVRSNEAVVELKEFPYRNM